MHFDKEEYKELFEEYKTDGRIRRSNQTFKIKLFLEKAENGLMIAKHAKDFKPTKDQPKRLHWDYWAITISYYSMLYAAKAAILSKGYEVSDHDAAQIALGCLLVPGELEKEDLFSTLRASARAAAHPEFSLIRVCPRGLRSNFLGRLKTGKLRDLKHLLVLNKYEEY